MTSPSTRPPEALADEPSSAASSRPDIVVYWRPGCGFCGRLLRQLEQAQVAHLRVNIWDDPDAAAIVRSVANGCETVPTVIIGDIGLVNPTVHDILDILDILDAVG